MEITVQPGARRAGVRIDSQGRLRVAVNASPERGKANDAVILALAGALGCHRRDLSIESGATARVKRVRISGCTARDLDRLLANVASDVPR